MWMESRMLFPALSPASDVLPQGAPEARPAASKGLCGPSRRQGAQGPFEGAPQARKKADQLLASLRCFTVLSASTHAHTHTRTVNTLICVF